MTIFQGWNIFSKKKTATLGIWISARRKADFSVDPEDSDVTQLVMEGFGLDPWHNIRIFFCGFEFL